MSDDEMQSLLGLSPNRTLELDHPPSELSDAELSDNHNSDDDHAKSKKPDDHLRRIFDARMHDNSNNSDKDDNHDSDAKSDNSEFQHVVLRGGVGKDLVGDVLRTTTKARDNAWDNFFSGEDGREVAQSFCWMSGTLKKDVAKMAKAQLPWAGWQFKDASILRLQPTQGPISATEGPIRAWSHEGEQGVHAFVALSEMVGCNASFGVANFSTKTRHVVHLKTGDIIFYGSKLGRVFPSPPRRMKFYLLCLSYVPIGCETPPPPQG